LEEDPVAAGDVLTVLSTRIEIDEAARRCDAYFDTATTGESLFLIPRLPKEICTGQAHPAAGLRGREGAAGAASFRIGLLHGPSGSAKSVLLRHYWGSPTEVEWDPGRPVLAHWGGDAGELLVEKLAAVGFDRPADQIGSRRYGDLSQGERTLLDLARMLGQDDILIDEFTSALDRRTARRCARGVGDYVRRHGSHGMVVATCHGDILQEIGPDWVFETGTGEMSWLQRCKEEEKAAPPETQGKTPSCAREEVEEEGSEGIQVLLLREAGGWSEKIDPRLDGPTPVRLEPPEVEVRLVRCGPGAWEGFKAHHYKTETLSSHAEAFLALARRKGPEGWIAAPRGGGERGGPAGFVATIRQMGKAKEGGLGPRRAHRTVVLPEWQGLGVGSRLSDAVAELYFREGREYYGQTVHPRLGAYRDESPRWEATKYNHTTSLYKIENWKQRNENVRVRLRNPRFLYSHRYVGGGGAAAAGPRGEAE